MLTVNLSKNQALTQSTGITEIEVLDENNHPVEALNFMLTVKKTHLNILNLLHLPMCYILHPQKPRTIR